MFAPDLEQRADLADATLVVVAEQRSLNPIFTLDRDFLVYRLSPRKRALAVVPG